VFQTVCAPTVTGWPATAVRDYTPALADGGRAETVCQWGNRDDIVTLRIPGNGGLRSKAEKE